MIQADYDNDGNLDLFEGNEHFPSRLLRNEDDCSFLDSAVEAGELVLLDEVRSSGSYLSHNDTRLHFGLGEDDQVNGISVRWPSGTREPSGLCEANRELVLTEGVKGSPKKCNGHGPRFSPPLASARLSSSP